MTSISALGLKANGMAPPYCGCCAAVGSVGTNRTPTCPPASTFEHIPSLPLLLDAVVASANRCVILGVRYKPYWIMSDLAALSALGLALAFSSHLRQVSALGLSVGILGALLSHKMVLELKAALGAVAARSFLQDCLLIIIPVFIAINIAWDQPLNLTIAFLGLLLPLYGGIVRIGCFLGGCCYGEPSQHGVLYPQSIFTLECNWWRRYSPSPDPRQRVFPIQLVEIRSPIISFCRPYFSSVGTTSGGSVHLPSLSYLICNHTPRAGLLSRHERPSTLWTFLGSSTGMCLRARRRLSVLGLLAYELKAPRPRVPRSR